MMIHDCNPKAWNDPPHDRSLRPGAGALAAGTLVASAVLVAPIVLWARFGDAALLRTIAVTTASVLLCWVIVRALTRRYAARRLPPRPLPRTVAVPVPAPASCRSHDYHRTSAQRHRRNAVARPCGPRGPRPSRTSRGPRDVSCHAARPLARRSARRRTRP